MICLSNKNLINLFEFSAEWGELCSEISAERGSVIMRQLFKPVRAQQPKPYFQESGSRFREITYICSAI